MTFSINGVFKQRIDPFAPAHSAHASSDCVAFIRLKWKTSAALVKFSSLCGFFTRRRITKKENDRLLTYKYAFFDFDILDLSQNEHWCTGNYINRTAVSRNTGSLRNRHLEVMGARENGAREKDKRRDSARSVRPHILPPNACYAGYDTCYNCNFNKPCPSCMTWLCIVWAIRIIGNNKPELANAILNQQLLTKLCI